MGDMTLVDRITEEIKADKPEKKIRKDLLASYPRQVVEDAINEAEWKLKDGEHKPFDMSVFKTSDLTPDVDSAQLDVKQEDTQKLSPFFFLMILIVLVWLGIAVSFNVADTFGQAVTKVQKNDAAFMPYCMEHTNPTASFTAEELCHAGYALVYAHKTDDVSVKRECKRMTYDIRKIDECAAAVGPLVTLYAKANP